MLKFNNSWRYASPGNVPSTVTSEFSEIISKIARGKQTVLEHFKIYFASEAGATTSSSSNASWAMTDLNHYMDEASNNAPLFIEAFYAACQDLNKNGEAMAPDYKIINTILSKHGLRYQIDPPNLIATSENVPIGLPEVPLSLDENAQNII